MVAVKLPSQVLHELDGATFDTKIGGEVFDPPPEQGIFSWVEQTWKLPSVTEIFTIPFVLVEAN